MTGLILGRGANVQNRRTAVDEPYGIVRADRSSPAGALAEFQYERENEQDRRGSDQERMISGVLEQAIHLHVSLNNKGATKCERPRRSYSIRCDPALALEKWPQSIAASAATTCLWRLAHGITANE